MKRVFISHPLSNNLCKNKESVNQICKNIIKTHDNILPISPLHLWSFMEEDGHYRSAILYMCADLIDKCDEIWFYTFYNKADVIDGLSAGQQFEYNCARDMNKVIKFKDISN